MACEAHSACPLAPGRLRITPAIRVPRSSSARPGADERYAATSCVRASDSTSIMNQPAASSLVSGKRAVGGHRRRARPAVADVRPLRTQRLHVDELAPLAQQLAHVALECHVRGDLVLGPLAHRHEVRVALWTTGVVLEQKVLRHRHSSHSVAAIVPPSHPGRNRPRLLTSPSPGMLRWPSPGQSPAAA
jgi:hypothetical protein